MCQLRNSVIFFMWRTLRVRPPHWTRVPRPGGEAAISERAMKIYLAVWRFFTNFAKSFVERSSDQGRETLEKSFLRKSKYY